MKLKLNWDGVGIATSLACAIHCAILPLILTSLPLFGINIIHNVYFEWAMIFLAIAIGIYSLYHGFVKHHQSFIPMIIFTIGSVFLILKQFNTVLTQVFLFLAIILIITAHYMNYRLCHRTRCSSVHHKH